MLVPPSSSSLLGNLDPTKLKARQFSRSSGPVNSKSDNSLWTKTSAERQQRLADEVSGNLKKRRVTDAPVDEDTTGSTKRRKQDEEKIKKMLMNIHNNVEVLLLSINMRLQRNLTRKTGVSGILPEIWDSEEGSWTMIKGIRC